MLKTLKNNNSNKLKQTYFNPTIDMLEMTGSMEISLDSMKKKRRDANANPSTFECDDKSLLFHKRYSVHHNVSMSSAVFMITAADLRHQMRLWTEPRSRLQLFFGKFAALGYPCETTRRR